ncbi:VOC family protein [Deinococcus sonorensis]|uniref:VOC family protein n=2 Tax=Deinococcus sonorensis TaxID=309891 RepID=A0AAU7U7D6_9DEIO
MSITPNYLSFTVADLERALDFYRTLGLPIPAGAHLNAQGDAEDHVEITVGGLRIAWESERLIRQLSAGWTRPSGQSIGLGFQLDRPEQVDQTCQRMTGAGYTVVAAPYDAFWGQRYATVQDPDGHTLDLYAWLEQQA